MSKSSFGGGRQPPEDGQPFRPPKPTPMSYVGTFIASLRAKAIADKAAAVSVELEHAAVQCLEDALAMETCQWAALAKAKCHEDALAAEERRRAALAKAEREAFKLNAIASLQADMAELQVLTLATIVTDLALSTLLVVDYIIQPAHAPPLVGVSSLLFACGYGILDNGGGLSAGVACSVGGIGSLVGCRQDPKPTASSLHWLLPSTSCS